MTWKQFLLTAAGLAAAVVAMLYLGLAFFRLI
jgi:hypothetical protein